MEILKASDNRQIKRKSSINQYRRFLSTYKQGGWIPISYDVLESYTCDGAAWHHAIMTDDENWNGYHYPVATCLEQREQYLLTDKRGVEMRDLPKCQGKGQYGQYVDERRITNADNEAVGIANTVKYRMGLDYYVANDTLPAVE